MQTFVKIIKKWSQGDIKINKFNPFKNYVWLKSSVFLKVLLNTQFLFLPIEAVVSELTKMLYTIN